MCVRVGDGAVCLVRAILNAFELVTRSGSGKAIYGFGSR
jgi:hypothetical protein